tara:strand:+ start:176 stop:349 length:174 start_codon:yes stop_codon:yes gene_type:complete
MENLKLEYQRLKSQLVNQGQEESPDEVMWNDGILIAIDDLFQDVNKDITKLIILNLI